MKDVGEAAAIDAHNIAGVQQYLLDHVVPPTKDAAAAQGFATVLLGKLLETAASLIVIVNPAGRVLYANPAAERAVGVTLSDQAGQAFWQIFSLEEEGTSVRMLCHQLLNSAESWRFSTRFNTDKHEARMVLWSASSLTHLNTNLGILFAGIDVSDQYATQKRYEGLMQTAAEAVVVADRNGLIQLVNPATEEMFGYQEFELLGANVSCLMPEPYHSEHDGYLRRYLETGERHIIGKGRRVTGRRKDGSTFPLFLMINDVNFGAEHYLMGMMTDLSGQQALENDLLEIAEKEQERIANDLHDGLSSGFTALSLISGQLAKRLHKSNSSEAETADQLHKATDELLRQMRTTVHGLVPPNFEDYSLPDALERLVERYPGEPKINLQISCPRDLKLGDASRTLQFFRVIQEALTNAIKHSAAEQIWISLVHHRDVLTARIADDGCGYDPREPGRSGMGLKSMQYRAQLIGAHLQVHSQPDSGVLVTCEVHLPSIS